MEVTWWGGLDLEAVLYAFESDVVPEDLRSVVIVPLHKGKGEMIK